MLPLFLGLLACQPEPIPPPVPGHMPIDGEEVVATANGEALTRRMLDGALQRVPPEQRGMLVGDKALANNFVERVAIGQVLYAEAIEAGLHERTDVKDMLTMAAREALAAKRIEHEGDLAVTDEAVTAWYEDRSAQYQRPQVHASHILVKELTLADDLMKQLQDGADLAGLARQFSIDTPTASRGGDLGWFERDRMDKAFSKAAFEADNGALVGPVETRFGFHLIQVHDKRASIPLDEVRPRIEAALRKEAVDAFMRSVRDSMTVEHQAALILPPEPESDAPTEGDGTIPSPGEAKTPPAPPEQEATK